MIGLELGISVASAALRNEPTGAPTGFRSDVVATAKRALKRGEMLDGEGGFCVWGKRTPADISLEMELLPLGLAHNVKLERYIPEGAALQWSDVAYDPDDSAVKLRREMEAAFGQPTLTRKKEGSGFAAALIHLSKRRTTSCASRSGEPYGTRNGHAARAHVPAHSSNGGDDGFGGANGDRRAAATVRRSLPQASPKQVPDCPLRLVLRSSAPLKKMRPRRPRSKSFVSSFTPLKMQRRHDVKC